MSDGVRQRRTPLSGGRWYPAAVLCAAVLALNAAEVRGEGLHLTGVTQFTAVRQEGDEALSFGFDRVRLKWRGQTDARTGYMVQIDLMKATTAKDKDGDTPAFLKDAIITRDLGRGLSLWAGKFKTPVGMEFNTSGPKLDVVKRGLGQRLVFERNAGMMLRCRRPHGVPLSLAAGVFNAGPNQATAVGDVEAGQDYTLTARVSTQPATGLYGELSAGLARSHVQDQDDVVLLDAGTRLGRRNGLLLKGELLWRDDTANPAADGTDFYVQAGYLLRPWLEHVAKYERLDVTAPDGDRTDFTVGMNIFLNPRVPHQSRVSVNYVVSDASGHDALQMMWQTVF